MPNEEWGVKRLCPKCATRFYDLQNDPMTCPSCGAEFDLASLLDTGNKSAPKAKEKAETVEDAEVVDLEDDIILEDDDDDTDSSVDDELLEDDDDDTVNLDDIADVAADDED